MGLKKPPKLKIKKAMREKEKEKKKKQKEKLKKMKKMKLRKANLIIKYINGIAYYYDPEKKRIIGKVEKINKYSKLINGRYIVVRGRGNTLMLYDVIKKRYAKKYEK